MDEFWRGRLGLGDCAAGGGADARTHLSVAMEALGGLAAALGLGTPFAEAALARLAPTSIEIAISDAAQAGEAVRALGGIAGWDARTLTAVFEHRRAGGAALARVRIAAAHVSARSDEAFPWQQRTVQAFAGRQAQDFGWPAPPAADAADAARADALGLETVGRGMFAAAEAGAAGRITPRAVLGRMLDAADGADGARTVLRLRLPALPGRPYVIRAGTGGTEGAPRLVQWMLDAASGRALAGAAHSLSGAPSAKPAANLAP